MKSDVSYHYQNEGNASYLVATPAENALIRYQVKMLENNQIPNLLPFNIAERNGQSELYYEVTSWVTLAQILERKKLQKDEVLSLLRSLLGACRELPEYQLPVSGLQLTLDLVFIRAGNFGVRFVYLPAADAAESIESIRGFLKDLIMRGSIAASSDNLIAALLELLNRPDLNMQHLQEFLQLQCQDNPIPSGKKLRQAAPPAQEPERQQPQIVQQDLPPTNPAFDTTEFGRAFAPKPQLFPPEILEDSPTSTKKKGASAKRLIFIMLQGAFLLILGGLLTSGTLAGEDGSFSPLNLFGVLLIFGCVDFLIFRRFFKGKKSEDDVGKYESVPSSRSTPQAPPYPSPPSAPPRKAPQTSSVSDMAAPFSAPTPRPVEPQCVAPVHPTPAANVGVLEEYEETAFMDEGGEPCVVYYENGLGRRTPFQNGRLVVGTQKGQVDLVLPGPRVSHIHAEFRQQGEGFVIIDCNSKNGTYLNGSRDRITSNTPYPIQNGDAIRLANAELVFEC